MNKKMCAEKRGAIKSQELKKHLSYDPITGVFVWKKRKWRSAKGVAGCRNKKGYVVITINNKQYCAHHLAWLYCYGQWPETELDHKDTDRSNNRIGNLREASPVQNRANTSPRSTSGYKGVRRKWSRWEASLVSSGQYFYLGTFDTPEQASDAYNRKAVELYGEFARTA